MIRPGPVRLAGFDQGTHHFEVRARDWAAPDDRAFIERLDMFFLATVSPDGQPDCSYKGGLPGFVRVLDAHTLCIPDYDGNGMYRSWGNVIVNAHVGLLFIDFDRPNRLRVNGMASIAEDDELLGSFTGAPWESSTGLSIRRKRASGFRRAMARPPLRQNSGFSGRQSTIGPARRGGHGSGRGCHRGQAGSERHAALHHVTRVGQRRAGAREDP